MTAARIACAVIAAALIPSGLVIGEAFWWLGCTLCRVLFGNGSRAL